MIVTRLKLANARAVQAVEFSITPAFNVAIGVNGVGKTSALESVAVSLAAISRHINGLKRPVPTEQRARRAGDGAGQLTPFDPVADWWRDQRLARSAT